MAHFSIWDMLFLLPSHSLGQGQITHNSLVASGCGVRAHINGFDGVAKNVSHTKGRTVHYDVEHNMVNRAITS